MTSVQLNQTAQATANAAGTATITFPSVRLNRTWQGSVSVSGSPPGTAWNVLVGGQSVGTLFAPGPFGPVQLLSGQALSLAAANTLVSGNTYVATLSGVDDPSDIPSSYNGPSSVSSPGNQGGLLIVQHSVSPGVTQILPAPPSGFAYRIHSIQVAAYNISSALPAQLIGLSDPGAVYSFFLTTSPAIAAGVPFGQTYLANGVLIITGIAGVSSSGGTYPSGPSAYITMNYDLVKL